MDLRRRRFLIQAGAALASGCGSSSPRVAPGTCAAPADGPGLGYCLVASEKLRVPGAGRMAVGQAVVVLFDDSTGAIVVRDERGFYALSATCTHECCNVNLCADGACTNAVLNPSPCATPAPHGLPRSGAAFLCPCHGSQFAADGSVVTGPAHLPLPAVAMAIEGGDVLVDLTRAVPAAARMPV